MKKLIAANWKLNHSPQEGRAFFKEWSQLKVNADRDLVVFPTALAAEAVSESIHALKLSFQWGLQNFWVEAQGAFTGENSAKMAKDLGASWALIGHSERRTLIAESNELINKKVKHALSLGLLPMLCIGEGLQERQGGRTFEVIARQLEEGLKDIGEAVSLAIAYEPVWAIGTGVVATPEQVQETHHWIQQWLKDRGFSGFRILYGGSVKPDNAKQLLSLPYVDGFLVGGASLKTADFQKIVEA